MNMILSIIIPVYNEKNTILKILEKIERVNLDEFSFKKEVIIVDDGSTDGTGECLRGLGQKYKIIFHKKNIGKGGAIKTGLGRAIGDYVIIQDADLEYDPQDYKQIIECALENNAQVVYGSRKLNPQNKPRYASSYYWGGIFLNWATMLICARKISDESTCYKFFKTEFMKSLYLKSKGFEICAEATAKIIKKGVKVYEVPIKYYPRSIEQGKKIKWIDGLRALRTLIKYRFFD